MHAEGLHLAGRILIAAGAGLCGVACSTSSSGTTSTPTATVASVSITPANPSIVAGTTVQLVAATKDATGKVLTGPAVTWSSGNVALATVSAAGLVAGVAVGGPVIITASSEGVNGTASVTITPVPVATVYDNLNNISWLADANLAATNRFGLPVCTASGPQPCVNPSGSMSYQAAAAWVQAMNAANYGGHTNWQIPTTPTVDGGCSKNNPAGGGNFGFNCSRNAMGSLYYNTLGLKAPNTAVPIPNSTVGPFSNFQPFLYWSRFSRGSQGYATLSFSSGWQGANTAPNFLYLLPMIQGKLAGTPAATGNGLEVNPGGLTVYDPVANVTWLANANVAATNTFGLPTCSDPTTPAICVNQDGAMTWDSANQLATNMNTYGGAGYLGQSHWELPPMDSCGGYRCGNAGDPLAELYSGQLGLSPGTPVVATPNVAVGQFKNMQPYLYWSCQSPTIQSPCQSAGPAAGFEWSFSFGNGFLGTDLLDNDLYVTAYFVGPSNAGAARLASRPRPE